MKKYSNLLCLMMALVFALAMTACGGSGQEAAPGEDAEAEQEEVVYDIAANLTETVNDDGSKTIDTDYFTLTLPLADTWTYEIVDEKSINFYNIAGREADCGGNLMTLVLYDPTDQSYNELPHACVAGERIEGIYVADFPSDVQADIENEEHMKQYEDVYTVVMNIEEQAKDSQTEAVSPLTIK